MRLIDADALLEGREDHEMISTHLIWNAPTIEAEPVIRCKDCEYFRPFSDDRNGCYNYAISVSPDHFCSSAERRTDAD